MDPFSPDGEMVLEQCVVEFENRKSAGDGKWAFRKWISPFSIDLLFNIIIVIIICLKRASEIDLRNIKY